MPDQSRAFRATGSARRQERQSFFPGTLQAVINFIKWLSTARTSSLSHFLLFTFPPAQAIIGNQHYFIFSLEVVVHDQSPPLYINLLQFMIYFPTQKCFHQVYIYLITFLLKDVAFDGLPCGGIRT